MGIGDTFSAIFLAIFDTNTFVSKQRLLHNNARGTTSRVSARTQEDVLGPKLHAMDTTVWVLLPMGSISYLDNNST